MSHYDFVKTSGTKLKAHIGTLKAEEQAKDTDKATLTRQNIRSLLGNLMNYIDGGGGEASDGSVQDAMFYAAPSKEDKENYVELVQEIAKEIDEIYPPEGTNKTKLAQLGARLKELLSP